MVSIPCAFVFQIGAPNPIIEGGDECSRAGYYIQFGRLGFEGRFLTFWCLADEIDPMAFGVQRRRRCGDLGGGTMAAGLSVLHALWAGSEPPSGKIKLGVTGYSQWHHSRKADRYCNLWLYMSGIFMIYRQNYKANGVANDALFAK
ncbi:hypothetical protein ACLB2K_025742 [Fragaria x ananassa]